MGFLSFIPWYYRLATVAALAVAAFWAGWIKGESHQQIKEQAALLAATQHTVVIQQRQAATTAKVDQAHQIARARIRTVYRTITKEVPVYVGKTHDASCRLSHGWLRLYNAAAMSTLPDPAGSLDATTSKITPVDVLGNATENYGACYVWRRKLIDLQEWVRAQARVIATK